jgi:hypothetical protein
MKFQIKHRVTGKVQFECELSAELETASYSLQLGFAVKAAVKAGANLAYADLTRASLTDANLAYAYLTRANLTDANLAGVNLAYANLEYANLAGVNLADANLAGTCLAEADLTRVDLTDANLTDANLAGVNLAYANLAGVNLAYAKNAPKLPQTEETEEEREARYAARAARFRERFPEVPVVEALDAKILSAINVEGCALDMSTWHKCETTHCRAGWAVTLAGKEGAELEAKYGPEDAGRRIYLASTGYVPNFFASNDAALEDIKARAATQLRAE